MNRNNTANKKYARQTAAEIGMKTAIHEAGHAAAIYLGNLHKQLPSVNFQIYFKAAAFSAPSKEMYCSYKDPAAYILGGRLSHVKPLSLTHASCLLAEEMELVLRAFDADIVNLLVGPLAEAKYVALNDNELINPRLVNLDSLQFYGGSSDLQTVREYLDLMFDDPVQQEKKILELFLAAYSFINDKSNWKAITALADYIVATGKDMIDSGEAIAILEPYAIKSTVTSVHTEHPAFPIAHSDNQAKTARTLS